MKQELRDQLHRLVQEVGVKIQPHLPTHESHPAGRNGIAHIYHVIKTLMGVPAKDVPDDRYEELLEIVEFCVTHVNDKHICSQLRDKYKPEPKQQKNTLEDFL